jgi:amino acid adenylation domain-containing protein
LKGLDKKNIQDVTRCTPTQEGMLFHTLEAPDGLRYVSQLCVGLAGDVDVDTVKAAWDSVVAANDALRTVFQWERVSHPLQVVLKRQDFQFSVEDLSLFSGDQAFQALEVFKADDRSRGFDFQSVPFRVTLVILGDRRYQMVVCHHHILYDGWSNGILLKEFFAAYGDLSAGREPVIPAKIPFKNYLKWLESRDEVGLERYWTEYLDGVTEPTLVLDGPNVVNRPLEPRNIRRDIPGDLMRRIEALCATQRLTSAALFYLGWGVLLQRITGKDDVLFGTTVSGRSGALEGAEQLVGMCINTLPLRIAIDEERPQLAAALKVQLDLQEREYVEHTPLVKISSLLPATAGALFDTVVIVENYPLDDRGFAAGELAVDSYSVFEITNYPLAIGITLGERANLNVAFHDGQFDRQTVEALLDRYLTILHSIAGQPYKQLAYIQLLSELEKHDLLYTFNDTTHDIPADLTLVDLMERQAELTPEAVALVGRSLLGDEEGLDYHITFKEMWSRAGRLASVLKNKGIGSGSIVGVMMPRRLELAAVLAAVMRCGAAYLPLAVDAPVERTAAMIGDSGVGLVLFAGGGVDFVDPVDFVDVVDLERSEVGSLELSGGALAEDWAYLIYTSGSTGRPKGVAIRHSNVVNTLLYRKEAYDLGVGHRALQLFPVIFDGFVTSFFTPLISGSAVILLSGGDILDMEFIAATIARQRISHFISTPSLFQVMIDRLTIAQAASLQAVTLAGESCSPYLLEAARQKNPNLEIVNEYGVTEASVLSTIYRHQEQDDAIKTGEPIWNTSIYIVDNRNRLQPRGVYGELCLAGIGVADGYLNRPELTDQRFVENPFKPGSLIYKTGDVACRLPDGTLQLAGRMDRQVKVRGFRIEPAEIEARLLRHEAVRETAVTVHEGVDAGQVLCAYVIAEKPVTEDDLRNYLDGKLPFYMIPNHFVLVEDLPKTPSGKIQYDALPHPDSLKKTGGFIAPKRRLESEIASVWQRVLKKEAIGIQDNFFDLGGNSLVAIRVAAQLKEKLNQDVPVLTLFRYPTVASLAQALGGEEDVEVQAMEDSGNSFDIACVGMAARLPEAENIHEFWGNLLNGDECIRRFSREELLDAGVPEELLDNPAYVPAKGYLDSVDLFDPEFFGYTPAQAEWMDPQVRLFHLCCWEALEDAGYDPIEYKGDIGLYAGANVNFPWLLQKRDQVTTPSEEFELVSLNSNSFVTLVAYRLNLTGPAVTIQTACSTSLVAIDTACQGLMANRCHMALAGGVSVILPAKSGYLYQEGMVKSPDGRCRAFDASADGTSSGDGVGVVVLKPLEQAREDGDHIYAVVKGSATNNDGNRRAGYSAPGPDGQADVIGKALKNAGVASSTIGYVEAHGTGTPLGDPIEIQGLTLAFGMLQTGTCGIGSVKTNIGHLDAAAGVAGFIKVCLALHNKSIPPSLNFQTPNPGIPFDQSPFYVVSQLTEWPAGNSPRRAGISSFGIGGTNAHAILEEAPVDPTVEKTDRKAIQRRHHLFCLSARSEQELATLTGNLADFLKDKPELPVQDIAFTLQKGRRHFAHRDVVVCSSHQNSIELLQNRPDKNAVRQAPDTNPPVVFLFPGLGGQYLNMGRELYETEPAFKEIVDECGQLSASIMGFDIRSILYPTEEPAGATIDIDSFLGGQAVMFTLEYGLATLLMEWGIRPSAMIGYSFGEYVAACVAGALTLEGALKLVAARGRLIQESAEGAMTSVPLAKEEVLPLLNLSLSLAIDNGPSCIVAGEAAAVDALEQQLKGRKIFCMRLPNSHALHSHMMEPLLDSFEAAVREIELKKPSIPYVSNVTGHWIDESEVTNPKYWVRHLRQTVRFADGLDVIAQEGDAVYIEVGPGRDLRSLLMRRLDEETAWKVVNLLPPAGYDRGADDYLLHRLGYLWQAGVAVDWGAFNSRRKARRVSLPTYPFQEQYYPVDGVSKTALPQANLSTRSPRLDDWFYIPQWRRQPLIGGHRDNEAGDSQLLIFAQAGGAQKDLASLLKENFGEGTKVVDPAREIALAPGTGHVVFIVPENTESTDYIEHVLAIAKRLPQLTADGDVRLTVITYNGFDVTGDEPLHHGAGMAAGLLKVIPQEIPGVCCRLIDVARPFKMETLLRELHRGEAGDVVALRGPHRWQLSYQRGQLDEPAAGESLLKPEGVYLVTGGLGDIGMTVCRYLIGNYQARLVVTGRNLNTGRLEELKALAGDVAFFTADVANVNRMQAVVTVAQERFGRIDGVFHMAGLVGGDTIAGIGDLTMESCLEQLKAKQEGSLSLEKIFRHRRLDFIWLTSSIASVLGGIHFFAYAAANAWMDAFGPVANREGKTPWIVVNWDALEADQTQSAVERILGSGLPQVVVSSGGGLEERIDRWVRLRELNVEEPNTEVQTSSSRQRPGIAADYVAPRNDTEQAIADVWAEVFGYGDIGVNDDFFELGGDSLKALTALSKVHRRLGMEIPVKEMFSHPTVARLAALVDPGAGSNYKAIPKAPDMKYYPLSSAQKRLYVLQQMEPGSVAYNETQCVAVAGDADRQRIESAFRSMIERHEALRTSIVDVEGLAMQAIHDAGEVPFVLETLNASGLAAEELVKSFIKPFDLSRPPFLRAAMAESRDFGPIMIIDMHHSITDAVSLQVFIDEFARLFNGQELDASQCRYRDFACWQQDRLQSDALLKQKDYWLAMFEGDIPVLNLPADFARPAVQDYDGGCVKAVLPKEQADAVKRMAAETGATTFMILLAAYYLFLARTSGQDDMVVGVPVAGRPHAELQEMIGIFVNTLALRQKVDVGLGFHQLLAAVKEAVVAAFENQDFQFEDLVENLDVKRDPSRNPLFDTYFVYEQVARREIDTGDTVFTSLELDSRVSKFDVVFNVFEQEGRLELTLEFAVKLFKPETAERMLNHFMELLRQVLDNPGDKLADIDFLTDTEKEIIINRFNSNQKEFPTQETVWDLIQKQAESDPERPAMVCRQRRVSYGQLVGEVRSLSAWYRENGMKAGQLLGVLLDRSIEMAIAILAAWDIGAAYIPLDSRHPAKRILEVTDDADCRFLVSVDTLLNSELTEQYNGAILRLTPEVFQRRELPPSAPVNVRSTAYVFYTSGSTGKPKGAMVEQIGMTNHMFAKIDDLQLDRDSIVAQNASHTFDISIWQFFVALINGGQTVIYPNHLVLDPDNLMEQVVLDRVTILEVVPSYLAVMLDTLEDNPRSFPQLRYLMVTGEVVKPTLVSRWFRRYPDIKMVNAYGPTEAADDITHHVMAGPVEGERVPVGKPVQNMTIYIVDPKDRLCPIGVKGEIWVSGIGVGRGYVNDHEKTMKVFDIDPFAQEEGIRLYKTGDLGRWLPDGSIDFFGRKDYQVKIRGFRIELGEIENRLLTLGLAREATVIDREDEKGEKMLCAYVVPKDSLAPADIRRRLKEVLPDYMVPATVTMMDFLPLNDNGKIDRKALPDPRNDDEVCSMPFVSLKQLDELAPEAWVKETADRIDEVIEDREASAQDREKILRVFNDTAVPFPQDLTVVDLFRERARKTPDRVALVFEDRHISFGEMDLRTDGGAVALRAAGIEVGDFVGLSVERSLELVMGVYAILKAGGAYVPLSSQFPRERVRYIIEACDIRVVLGESFVDSVDPVDFVDPVDALAIRENGVSLRASSLDAGYVMFTSGTTGQPKGVLVEHRSLVNFSLAMIRNLGFLENDIVLSLFTLTFDMSGTEIFSPLINGQRVVVGNFEEQLHTEGTASVLVSRCVSVFQGTPSNLSLLIGDEGRAGYLRGLRLVLAGAEPFPLALLGRLRKLTDARIFNLYGPTEATTYATCKELTDAETITIGKPIDNARIYIVNSSGGLQPIGVPGELCIGGEGVARGYVKQAELTAERFAPDPFVDGGRIYKTGDIAHFDESGDVVFMGRQDHQVQIDGFRVELTEIEHHLASFKDVRQAVVLAGVDKKEKTYLAAYLTAGSRLDEAGLRGFLSQKLPPFMIPGFFIQMELLPLNTNGKIDRSRFPAPDALPKRDVEFVAPSTELEETIASAWKQVLQLERVGVNENFFDLGGNSLAVIQLNRVLKERLQRDIPVVAMYEHLTIKAFVRFLQQSAEQTEAPPQPQADRSAALSKARDRRSQQKNKRRLK